MQPRIAPGKPEGDRAGERGDRPGARAGDRAAGRRTSSRRWPATAASSGAGSGSPAALMPGGKLPRADTELVILRVAHLTDSDYEWGASRAGWAVRAGLDRGGDRAGAPGSRGRGLGPAGSASCSAPPTSATPRAGSATRPGTGLAAELDEPLLIELCLLIGHYEMLAMTLGLAARPSRRAGSAERDGSIAWPALCPARPRKRSRSSTCRNATRTGWRRCGGCRSRSSRATSTACSGRTGRASRR